MYNDKLNQPSHTLIGSTVSGNFPLSNHTGGLSAEPQRVSQTEQETVALHEAVSEVSKLVMKLRERLTPVSRQQLPQTGSDVVAEENLPQLANAIRQSRYVTQGSILTLQDILERLDI